MAELKLRLFDPLGKLRRDWLAFHDSGAPVWNRFANDAYSGARDVLHVCMKSRWSLLDQKDALVANLQLELIALSRIMLMASCAGITGQELSMREGEAICANRRNASHPVNATNAGFMENFNSGADGDEALAQACKRYLTALLREPVDDEAGRMMIFADHYRAVFGADETQLPLIVFLARTIVGPCVMPHERFSVQLLNVLEAIRTQRDGYGVCFPDARSATVIATDVAHFHAALQRLVQTSLAKTQVILKDSVVSRTGWIERAKNLFTKKGPAHGEPLC